MAAPIYRTSVNLAGATTTSAPVTRPTLIYDNDYLVGVLHVEGGSRTITAPSGWTLLDERASPGPLFTHYLYVKRASDEPTSWTWSWTGSLWREMTIHVVPGALSNADPVDDWSENGGTSGNNVTGLAVDTTDIDRLIIFLAGHWNGGPWTMPSGMTERYDGTSANNLGSADVVQSASGSSGNKAATAPSTSSDWVAHLVALKPLEAGGPPFFVGAGTAVFTATASATLTPTLPVGTVENDLLILAVHGNNNLDWPEPSGWTKLSPGGVAEDNTTGQRVEVWGKFAGASESAPVLSTYAGTTVRGAQIFGFRGVPSGGTVSDAISAMSRSNNASSTTATWATITPPDANTILFAINLYQDNITASTEMSGWSAFGISNTTLGADMAITHASRAWPSASTATGALTSTTSGAAANVNVGLLFSFKPASTSTPVTKDVVASWDIQAAVTKDVATTWNLQAEATKDVATTWDIQNAVTADRAASWDIQAAITKDTAASWDVQAAVTKDVAATWNIENVVTLDRVASWNLQNEVTLDRVASWDIDALAAVTKDVVASWDIQAGVTKDAVATWNIQASDAKDVATTWDIQSSATKDVVATWDVQAAVVTDRVASWDVQAPVTKDAVASWNIQAPVTKDTVATWDVQAGVTTDRIATWDIQSSAVLDRIASWDVQAAVTKDAAASWNIQSSATKDVATTWNVQAAVTKDAVASWDIDASLTPVTKDVVASWNVQAAVAKDAVAIWDIQSSVTLDRSTTWNIENAIVLDRVTQWNIEQSVSVDRIASWDIQAAIILDRVASWNIGRLAGQGRGVVGWRSGKSGVIDFS